MSQPTGGPEVGQKAPDFTLPYSRTESATIADFAGKKKKVALCFYVLDFTGG
ncbi:MAG: redoxin domain-containing protein [Chloroflexi bacterium]|nr:redoxin domain-containing protein [Chloroflexota bacterium]